MRAETSKIVNAFVEGRCAHAARTMTDGVAIYLHGNRIAWKDGNRYYATLAGWPTNTTRDRLNGLARALGVAGFHQANRKQYHGDTEIGSHDVVLLKEDNNV